MEDGSLEKAIKYVNKALRYNTNSLRALILLGDTSFANKNFTDALKKYLAAYEKYPEGNLEEVIKQYGKREWYG